MFYVCFWFNQLNQLSSSLNSHLKTFLQIQTITLAVHQHTLQVPVFRSLFEKNWTLFVHSVGGQLLCCFQISQYGIHLFLNLKRLDVVLDPALPMLVSIISFIYDILPPYLDFVLSQMNSALAIKCTLDLCGRVRLWSVTATVMQLIFFYYKGKDY